jgi:DNA polymerase III delta prime subunit
MHNHSYAKVPKRWDDYFCGSAANQAEVNYLKRVVTQGVKAIPRSLFIAGRSGTGKTSLALLFIKSFKCLRRKPGEYEPCGECESCKDIDVRLSDRTLSGVVWVQPGAYTEETLNQSVKVALQTAAKGAANTGNADGDVLFVVFDEWQEFARNLRQQVLLRTEIEVPGNHVCYIFLTMREEDLAEEDRIALIRRSGSGVIRLGTLPDYEIARFLIKTYPDINHESAQILAAGSKGRLGLATAMYDSAVQKFDEVSPEVAAYIAQAATDHWRWELWQKLQEGYNFQVLISLLKSLLEIVSSTQLCQQMQEDILQTSAMTENFSSDQMFALSLLTQYELASKSVNFVSYILQLSKLKLVEQNAVMRHKHLELTDYVNL